VTGYGLDDFGSIPERGICKPSDLLGIRSAASAVTACKLSYRTFFLSAIMFKIGPETHSASYFMDMWSYFPGDKPDEAWLPSDFCGT
jgi:hypothetical protein